MVSFHHLCGTLDADAIPCKLTLSEVYHNRQETGLKYWIDQHYPNLLFISFFLIALQMRLCR